MYYKDVPEKEKMPTLISTQGKDKRRGESLNEAQIMTFKLGRLPLYKSLTFLTYCAEL